MKLSSPRIPRISQKQRCLSVYLSPINGMTTPYLRDSAFSHDDSQRIGIVDVLSKPLRNSKKIRDGDLHLW